jgi:hypothetical protein
LYAFLISRMTPFHRSAPTGCMESSVRTLPTWFLLFVTCGANPLFIVPPTPPPPSRQTPIFHHTVPLPNSPVHNSVYPSSSQLLLKLSYSVGEFLILTAACIFCTSIYTSILIILIQTYFCPCQLQFHEHPV